MNQKDHIKATALSLFATHGYGLTSIAQIARTAGVAQGLMYNFYASKEALLQDILLEGLQDVLQSLSAYTQMHDPRLALRAHIRATVQTVTERAEFWRLFHGIRLQSAVRELLGAQFLEAQKNIVKTLAGNFKKLRYPHPTEEARLFFAQIDGMVGLYLVDPKAFDLTKMEKALYKRYKL